MRTVRMSWNTDEGRLCRWVESQECENNRRGFDVAGPQRGLLRKRKSLLRNAARMTNLVTLYKVLGRGAQASDAEHRRSTCQSLHRL
jgi:hypothetical protein